MAEAMSLAIPVIVTNHSGPKAFATPENSFLVPVLRIDERGFAEPDVEALGSIMRFVWADPAEACRRGANGRETMREMSPQKVVSTMIDRIRYQLSIRGWE